MPDENSKSGSIPRDDLPRRETEDRREQRDRLDVPQNEAGEDNPSLQDRMVARQSIPIRHIIPDYEEEREQPAQEDIREVTGEPTEKTRKVGVQSESIIQRRLRRFRSFKRGYWAFIILVGLYLISFLLPLLVNSVPLVVRYEGEYSFPAFADVFGTPYYPASDFGVEGSQTPADFRELDEQWEAEGSENWALMPIYPWNPLESDFAATDEETGYSEPPPHAPSKRHLLGTDNIGRDVLSRMAYGFNISISFGILLTILSYLLGTAVGAVMGYFGGKTDILSQRGIEIWQTMPALYVIIIVSSMVLPSFMLLVLLLTAFSWMAMTYYIRGEFFREKAKDYVAAAISLGTNDRTIIFKHILPNALTPLIAYFPFSVVTGITALVSLDFLGYGLPPPTPSWGQMISVGLAEFSGNFQNWWLVIVPVSALFVTLLLVTFIGEALREAFDPKVFSRLR